MTRQLPNELKIQIIQHVDRKSLPAILRVNSTFHIIGEPLLYHTIILQPFPFPTRPLEAATGFLKTITERPALAAAVHCLGLDLFDWRPYNRPSRSDVRAKRFFEAFRTALPKILNLQDLEICNWGNSVVDAIGQLPRGCQFPALQHYSGPMEILGETRSNALKTLRVSTAGAGTVTILDAFSAAARLSGQTLRALHLRCQGGDGDNGLWATVYAEIALFFPKLRYLGLESRYTVTHVSLIWSASFMRMFRSITRYCAGSAGYFGSGHFEVARPSFTPASQLEGGTL